MPGLWRRDQDGLIAKAGEPTGLAGLGARVPRSETVQELSAAGVAVHVNATGTGKLKECESERLPYMQLDSEHTACFP